MAITTLDGAISGMTQPFDFCKSVSGTLVAGRPMSLLTIAGAPTATALNSAPNNLPQTWAITANTKANPTVVSVTGHPWATNDTISIINSNSTPSIDGIRVITYVSANSFSIPVDCSAGVAGTSGSAAGQTSNGGAGLTGYVLTDFRGLPFINPLSGNSYLARLQAASSTQTGTLMLCDRLWHNGGIAPTLTTIQNFTSSLQIPARDGNGSTTGDGVFAALEVYSVLGATSFTPTLTYTNTTGGTSTSSTFIAVPSSSIAGSFYPFTLASGDVGVQKAQAITLNSTATSGQMGVVLYRVIARLEINGAGLLNTNSIDALTGCMPRVYNNTCPFLVFVPTTTATTNIMGHVIWTQG
jgi:hypothetical protein